MRMIERLKKWIVKHWRLKTRAFAAWRQKQYRRAVEFRAVNELEWKIRKDMRSRERAALSTSSRIAKPSRQLYRALQRKLHKQQERMK